MWFRRYQKNQFNVFTIYMFNIQVCFSFFFTYNRLFKGLIVTTLMQTWHHIMGVDKMNTLLNTNRNIFCNYHFFFYFVLVSAGISLHPVLAMTEHNQIKTKNMLSVNDYEREYRLLALHDKCEKSQVNGSEEKLNINNVVECKKSNPEVRYDEFSPDSIYVVGDIVTFNDVTYEAQTGVGSNSFFPGQVNPWTLYVPLALWNPDIVYNQGDEVLGTDGYRYIALFYNLNVDPTLIENQNPNQDNGRPWLPKGEWHNFSQQELEQAPNIDVNYFYPVNTLVKYRDMHYLNANQVQGVMPDDKNPWKIFIDWGDTKEIVGTSKTDWPKSFYSPYIDFVMNEVPDMAQLKNDNGVSNFVLAFIVAKRADTCMPTWGASYPVNGYSQYLNIKALRDVGGDVMVSLGGASNVSLAMACNNIDDLAEVYDGIVKNLNLKAIDFDIEGMAVADIESINRRSQAISLVQQRWLTEGIDIKVWFTLPVMPEGLTADGINVLNSAKEFGVHLDGINVMAMDYGSPQCQSNDTEGQNIHGNCAISALNSLFTQVKSIYPDKSDEQVWNMLGTTPMIGYNDVLGEVFYKSDANLVLEHAQQHDLGMIGIWSMLRDRPGVAGQVSPEHSGLTSQQAEEYGFSRIFNLFTYHSEHNKQLSRLNTK